MTELKDTNGRASYDHTTLNQLAYILEPSGKLTTYAYDASGNRTLKVEEGNGKHIATTYELDGQNRLSCTEQALGIGTRTERYLYDDAGNVLHRLPEVMGMAGVGEEPGEMTLAVMGRTREEDVDPALDTAAYVYNNRNQISAAIRKSGIVENGLI